MLKGKESQQDGGALGCLSVLHKHGLFLYLSRSLALSLHLSFCGLLASYSSLKKHLATWADTYHHSGRFKYASDQRVQGGFGHKMPQAHASGASQVLMLTAQSRTESAAGQCRPLQFFSDPPGPCQAPLRRLPPEQIIQIEVLRDHDSERCFVLHCLWLTKLHVTMILASSLQLLYNS